MPDEPAAKTSRGRPGNRRTAVRHGLYTGVDVAAREEGPADWLAYHDEILADLRPHGALERSLASRAAALFWRLRRVAAAETDVIERTADREHAIRLRHPNVTAEDVAALPNFTTVMKGAPMTRINPATLFGIMKVEAHLNRQLLHTLHELEVARDRREGKPTPLARVDVQGLPGA